MMMANQKAGKTFLSSEMVAAATPLAGFVVNVTNTGSVDADDVVLGFVKPPGAGQNGVPLQSLFDFSRVHVPAGQTVSVQMYPALTEYTQIDVSGTRQVLEGAYTFFFGVKETVEGGMGYAEHTLHTY
jgi:pre-mRNA-splicing factor SYF2/beta-D-xylosidase 4